MEFAYISYFFHVLIVIDGGADSHAPFPLEFKVHELIIDGHGSFHNLVTFCIFSDILQVETMFELNCQFDNLISISEQFAFEVQQSDKFEDVENEEELKEEAEDVFCVLVLGWKLIAVQEKDDAEDDRSGYFEVHVAAVLFIQFFDAFEEESIEDGWTLLKLNHHYYYLF